MILEVACVQINISPSAKGFATCLNYSNISNPYICLALINKENVKSFKLIIYTLYLILVLNLVCSTFIDVVYRLYLWFKAPNK